MKKMLLLLCLCSVFTAITQTTSAATPQELAVAPDISPSTLVRLSWLPLTPPISKEIVLDASSQMLDRGISAGPVAALALPADQGALEITLISWVRDGRVYVPNVVVLDEQRRSAAFYPSSHFPYRQQGVVARDRLEGIMRLVPALGQTQIYLLIYTTQRDLARTTVLKNPAKAYAEGVGNAIPSIPDPVARHVAAGVLDLKVKAEQNSGSVTIGQTQFPPLPSRPVAVSADALLEDTENHFNNSIMQAVKLGDIDKALRLMDEAEHLGSSSARDTFIRSVKGKG